MGGEMNWQNNRRGDEYIGTNMVERPGILLFA